MNPSLKLLKPVPVEGRKGKTHKKFSASLEENLFNRVKSLPGQFSRHLANALSTYLSVMKRRKRVIELIPKQAIKAILFSQKGSRGSLTSTRWWLGSVI